MEMISEQRIPAPVDVVWAALNNPEVLKEAMPGCESFEEVGDNRFTARLTTKVGPVKARFEFKVSLTDVDPPNGYIINGEGQGGAAGFAKGSANVRLVQDATDTLLSYSVKANVGGKLAQLGGRLIDGTAKKLADEFFSNFIAQVCNEEESADQDQTEVVGKSLMAQIAGIRWASGKVWISVLLVIVFAWMAWNFL
ncbi:MAG: carbon monoxide dehydrogenase subunit G [Gammaproteobacteria bacterium]|nr:carbon monoxide dehydrogenase subunit G [Gammaproteobacteria bacterium]MCY4358184.1 carbon monoxide dehydrogenase subunit G [Gammaproteobacteria bacterium]